MNLEESYRTALLLSYFEEWPPRTIAERAGTPIATIKTQLQRGLDKLRTQLDDRHRGDRSSWLMALIPLASPPAQATSMIVKIGVLLLSSKILFVASAALLTSGVYAILAPQGDSVEVASAATETLPAETRPKRTLQSPPEATTKAGLPQAADREALSAPVATHSDPAEVVLPPASLKTLHVRVLDSEGDPLTGVEMSAVGAPFSLEQETPIVDRSGVDGRFEVEVSEGISAVVSNDERYATVLAATTRVRGTQTESILILGERMDFTGRVFDDFGLSLEGATASYLLPKDFRARVGEIRDYSNSLVWNTNSNARGAGKAHYEAYTSASFMISETTSSGVRPEVSTVNSQREY